MNNELAVLDGFQCAWRLLRRRNGKNVAGGAEGERVSEGKLLWVDARRHRSTFLWAVKKNF